MEIAATVGTELLLSGIFRVVSILEENFRDVKTTVEIKPLIDFVDCKFKALISEKSDDLVQLMPSLEKLQAAALELEDLLDFYEYDQIEKQVNSSSSEPIPKEQVLPTHLRNGLDELLMAVEQLENKRQSITSKTGTTQTQADNITPTIEIAAKVGTELALSGLFRVVSILEENFRDVNTMEEMKPLNDFVSYKFEALIRDVKSDHLIQLMPTLEELQTAALEMEDQLDLYEYEQTEKQLNPSSSEPIPNEKVLPQHLGDGLNRLLKIVGQVENIRQHERFIDFLVGDSHVARPAIMLALSDVSRLIKMLGSNFTNSGKILEQLKDVVGYHIEELIEYVNSNDLVDEILDLIDRYEFDHTEIQDLFEQVSSSYSIPLEKFKANLKEELTPTHPKSPLRIGLEKLLKFLELVEKKHPSITSSTDTTQSQANAISPTLRIGVEKWLKFVEQVEKEHPFITSKKDTAHRQDYTSTPISTTFFPSRGFLSTTNLENGKCQEDAEEIMRNHKNNLKELIFEWTDISSSTDTCKEVLERLEPDQNLENLSIINYSCYKFPNWMVKENWLPHLRKLTLRSCTSLKIVPFLPPCLESIYVENCHGLMQLPLVSDALQFIKLSDCPRLTSLGNLQRCTSLKWLTVYQCPMLRGEEASLVEGVAQGDIANRLPQVNSIVTDEPLLILELVQQQAFSSIQSLNLKGLRRSFFDMSDKHFHQFSSLTLLEFQGCTVLPNLEKLSSLKKLYIFNCSPVEWLPNLPVSVQFLYVGGCPKLKEKYGEGGPLRSTVSHIPTLLIH